MVRCLEIGLMLRHQETELVHEAQQVELLLKLIRATIGSLGYSQAQNQPSPLQPMNSVREVGTLTFEMLTSLVVQEHTSYQSG